MLWLPTTLLVERYPIPVEWVTCSAACPRNAFLVPDREPAVIGHLVIPARELLLALLLLGVAARQVQRIAGASRIRRRTLMPVLAVTAVVIVVHASGYLVRRLVPDSRELTHAAWLNAFALPEMALAFLAGLIGWQLYVGSSLQRFARSLSSPPSPKLCVQRSPKRLTIRPWRSSTPSPRTAGPPPMGGPSRRPRRTLAAA